MRIRSVKPEFWRDRPLASLSADARLFYIGLWMEADDAGWLTWDLAEIAADLYPYRPTHSRERQVGGYLEQLLGLPGEARVVIYDCGHARVANLVEHQRFGGTRSLAVLRKHESACLRAAPRSSAEDLGSSAMGGEGRGGAPTERNGRGGVEGKPTNGADHTRGVEAALALLKDPASNTAGRHAARRTLERYAPALLEGLADPLPVPKPTPRPRSAAP
jgi:hypothetical protein